jgi:hypothetical protein
MYKDSVSASLRCACACACVCVCMCVCVCVSHWAPLSVWRNQVLLCVLKRIQAFCVWVILRTLLVVWRIQTSDQVSGSLSFGPSSALRVYWSTLINVVRFLLKAVKAVTRKSRCSRPDSRGWNSHSCCLYSICFLFNLSVHYSWWRSGSSCESMTAQVLTGRNRQAFYPTRSRIRGTDSESDFLKFVG